MNGVPLTVFATAVRVLVPALTLFMEPVAPVTVKVCPATPVAVKLATDVVPLNVDVPFKVIVAGLIVELVLFW